LLASQDDPYNPAATLPHAIVARSAHLVAQFTSQGGHQGFVSGAWPWRAEYWAEQQVVRFLHHCHSVRDRPTSAPV
jgi:predicted alpha/beta-fold hydrolase